MQYQNEITLLRLCARGTTAVSQSQFAACLQRPLDWHWLLPTAHMHGVLPLLAHHLAGQTAVPPNAQRALWVATQDAQRRSQQQRAILTAVSTRLTASDIPCIPFKGVALATAVYPRLHLRPANDIDLLVPQRHVAAAAALLEKAGYRPTAVHPHLQRFGCELGYHHPDHPVAVELHWHILPRVTRLGVDMAAFWTSTVPQPDGTLAFAPEDLLLILCLHGGKHRWSHLKWIADVHHCLLAYPQLDWARLAQRSRAMAAQRPLRIGLQVAHALLQTPLPRDWQQRIIQDRRTQRLATAVIDTLFTPQHSLGGQLPKYRYWSAATSRLSHRLYVLSAPLWRLTPRDLPADEPAPPLWWLYLSRWRRLWQTHVVGKRP